MHKQTAIEILGGTPKKAMEAMGYKTIQAIYMWPDQLPQSLTDKVNGAAIRLKAVKQPRKQPAKAV